MSILESDSAPTMSERALIGSMNRALVYHPDAVTGILLVGADADFHDVDIERFHNEPDYSADIGAPFQPVYLGTVEVF